MKNFFTLTLCFLTLSLTAQEACPNVFDFDNDGNVAVNDFLAMLGYFGDTDSDSDGVWDSEDDCLDLGACNYSANPTEPCAYVYDALGICGGNCATDEDEDGVCDCGDLVSHEGYDYSTVLIGEQCWFAENCRYLPEVSPSNQGSQTSTYYYVFGFTGTDVEAAKSTTNYETYGVLYNWPAVMTEGICPSGWHIPSDEEFTELTDFLGGEDVAGVAMKSTTGWNDGGSGSNSSGFNGLPGGLCANDGFYSNGSILNNGYWWSASENGYIDSQGDEQNCDCDEVQQGNSYSWRRQMDVGDNVQRSIRIRNYGYSARCVRDD
jgi:uncharacterized protein (TIGR02145 family)